MTTAETFIAEVVAGLEDRHGIGAPSETETCATGDDFVVICSGGEKANSGRWPALCASPEIAAELWADALIRYAEGRTGKIYWRFRPTVESFQITHADRRQTHRVAEPRYTVFSRLFIAEKADPAEVAA